MMIDGFGMEDMRMLEARIEQETARRYAEREAAEREELTKRSGRCLDCKHFFYGDYKQEWHPQDHDDPDLTMVFNHEYLKGWDYNNPVAHNSNQETYQKGLCRRYPEYKLVTVGHQCGEHKHEHNKLAEMKERYGDDSHELFHKVFPERTWYSELFPRTMHMTIETRTITAHPETHMEDELFEVD
jgi:hypothetical protein